MVNTFDCHKHINNHISKSLAAFLCLLSGKTSSLGVSLGSESSTYTHPLCFLRAACFGASGVGGGVTGQELIKNVYLWLEVAVQFLVVPDQVLVLVPVELLVVHQ